MTERSEETRVMSTSSTGPFAMQHFDPGPFDIYQKAAPASSDARDPGSESGGTDYQVWAIAAPPRTKQRCEQRPPSPLDGAIVPQSSLTRETLAPTAAAEAARRAHIQRTRSARSRRRAAKSAYERQLAAEQASIARLVNEPTWEWVKGALACPAACQVEVRAVVRDGSDSEGASSSGGRGRAAVAIPTPTLWRHVLGALRGDAALVEVRSDGRSVRLAPPAAAEADPLSAARALLAEIAKHGAPRKWSDLADAPTDDTAEGEGEEGDAARLESIAVDAPCASVIALPRPTEWEAADLMDAAVARTLEGSVARSRTAHTASSSRRGASGGASGGEWFKGSGAFGNGGYDGAAAEAEVAGEEEDDEQPCALAEQAWCAALRQRVQDTTLLGTAGAAATSGEQGAAAPPVPARRTVNLELEARVVWGDIERRARLPPPRRGGAMRDDPFADAFGSSRARAAKNDEEELTGCGGVVDREGNAVQWAGDSKTGNPSYYVEVNGMPAAWLDTTLEIPVQLLVADTAPAGGEEEEEKDGGGDRSAAAAAVSDTEKNLLPLPPIDAAITMLRAMQARFGMSVIAVGVSWSKDCGCRVVHRHRDILYAEPQGALLGSDSSANAVPSAACTRPGSAVSFSEQRTEATGDAFGSAFGAPPLALASPAQRLLSPHVPTPATALESPALDLVEIPGLAPLLISPLHSAGADAGAASRTASGSGVPPQSCAGNARKDSKGSARSASTPLRSAPRTAHRTPGTAPGTPGPEAAETALTAATAECDGLATLVARRKRKLAAFEARALTRSVDVGWSAAEEIELKRLKTNVVSFLLCTVTFYANLADSLTRSP